MLGFRNAVPVSRFSVSLGRGSEPFLGKGRGSLPESETCPEDSGILEKPQLWEPFPHNVRPLGRALAFWRGAAERGSRENPRLSFWALGVLGPSYSSPYHTHSMGYKKFDTQANERSRNIHKTLRRGAQNSQDSRLRRGCRGSPEPPLDFSKLSEFSGCQG